MRTLAKITTNFARFLLCLALLAPKPVPNGAVFYGQNVTSAGATCGNTTVEAGSDATDENYLLAGASCVAPANLTAFDCKVYTNAVPSGSVQCGLYDSNGSGGSPGSVLCYGSGVAATANSWNTVAISSGGGCPMTAGHTYWIVVDTTYPTLAYAALEGQASGTSYYQAQSYNATTMSSFSGTATAYTALFSVYVDMH